MGSGALPLAITTKSCKITTSRLQEKPQHVSREPRSARPTPLPGIGLGDAHDVSAKYQANRVIRIGKLNALPRFHTRPINVVVYHDSSGRPRLKVGFPLRCIQRLSRPHIATRRCRWRDNRYTRGASIPVLSY